MAQRSDRPPASDLGQRIRRRREQLGLTLESAAAKAGIDPGYLDYLETAASPDPSRGTLLHLSVALETSAVALLGGDRMLPPGHQHDARQAALVTLDEPTARALIAPGGVGRVVFVEARGPVALPVNFRMLGDSVVFRTESTTSIAQGTGGQRISFEVDQIDDTFSTGWSVLVSGVAHEVQDAEELEAVRALDLVAWAGGPRETFFRLDPDTITGRQLRAPE
jgi:transcriptional regulator with XRE-family HTH domain